MYVKNVVIKDARRNLLFIMQKNTKNINQKMAKTKDNRLMMLPKCAICNNKKSKFISQGSGLLDNLGLNIPRNRMKDALWNALG